jgi:hypothetical protein
MPWVNTDDLMPEHPKVWSLSDAAYRLHHSGISYCNRQLTDGLISADKVPTLVPRYKKTALAELVDRGMWNALMDGQAYVIHDFLDWNRSRAQVIEAREKKSRAGRKGAEVKWGTQ